MADRLATVLTGYAPAARTAARTALASVIQQSYTVGDNPLVTARQISRQFAGITYTRAATIARTEMGVAGWSRTQQQYANDPAVRSWQWMATFDGKGCNICTALHGREYPTSRRLETHPNAVLEGPVFFYGGLQEMVAARYDGPAISITTMDGHRLTIGPNHPVFTTLGLVRAKYLRPSDQVIYDGRYDGAATLRADADLVQVPSLSDAFHSLLATGEHSYVPATRHDLHGDRVGVEGKVEVVRPVSHLLPVVDPAGIEQCRQPDLMRADADLLRLTSEGACGHALWGVDAATSGGVGGGGAGGGVAMAVAAPDAAAGAGILGAVTVEAPFVVRTVARIRRHRFSGWAYDASTIAGTYNVGGLVVSNCRCTMLPVTRNNRPIGADETGVARMRGMNYSALRAIWGPTRALLIRDGADPLSLISSRTHPVFGRTPVVKSLKQIRG